MRETIEMVREAGIDAWWDSGSDWRETFNEHLKAFEALVRADAIADEREACAKVCEDGVQNANDWDSSYWDQACENRAAAIRSRSSEH
jgi:hypothetical protein